MRVETIPYHYDNFAYILVCPKTGDAAIIDPGEYFPIQSAVEDLGVKVTTILCTHHHADHIGGLEDFCKDYPGLQVVGYKDEKSRIKQLNVPVAGGDTISVGKMQGLVLFTPGHTRGSICFSFGDCLFTGDTLFGGGCGRLFEGTPEQMFHSMRSIMSITRPETKIYFGHEYTVSNLKFAKTIEPDNPDIAARLEEAEASLEDGKTTTPSTMAVELATNPFLRSEATAVIETVSAQGLVDSTDPVTVFTAVRQLKDSY